MQLIFVTLEEVCEDFLLAELAQGSLAFRGFRRFVVLNCHLEGFLQALEFFNARLRIDIGLQDEIKL